MYREELRALSEGDRVQFTAPVNDLKVANRELGTIQSIGEDGRLNLRTDDSNFVQLDPNRLLHLDHGYAVTSHSSQGQTADHVLINVDTELGAKDLLNSRMAYVAISRGAHEAQIFTNDATALGTVLSRDVSHAPAIHGRLLCHKASISSPLAPRKSARDLVWACKFRSKQTFPDSRSVAEARPVSRPRCARAGSRSGALTPAIAASAYHF